jgi:4-amino-4-deoxy-L-arabinose transferase-like glycosyltransferase
MPKKSREEPKSRLRRSLIMLSILLITIGLIELYSVPVNWDLVIPQYLWLVLVGMALFVVSMLIRPGQKLETFLGRLAIPGQAGWILVAVLLSCLAAVTMVAFERGGRVNYIPVITFWLAAGAAYAAAFLPNLPDAAKTKAWFMANKTELILVGVVTLVGAGLRLYKLGIIPFAMNGDEGRMALQALGSDKSSLANPFALWENFGGLYLQAINICFKFFGATSFSLRLLPAIGGILAIPAVYLLARKIAGSRVALISAALVAFSHTHMHFSRTAAVGYIQATWLVPLELYFFLSGIDKRSSWRVAVAGILIGIHYSVYLTSQLVSALALVFRKWIKPAWRQVLVFWGGLGIMLIPEAAYIIKHPNMFFERISREGTFQSGWLESVMATSGKGMLQVLAERVLHAFLSLFYYPSIDFYGSTIPMLSLIGAMLFLAGLIIVLLRKQTPGSLLLNGYFWGFTLSVGLFAIPPSADSYRMLIALPAAFIMAGIGLDTILEVIGMGWERRRRSYIAISSITLASLLIFNMWSYFDDFIGHCLYGDDMAGRFASYLGSYAGSLDDPGLPVYVLSDDIFFYGSHASATFLKGDTQIFNVPDGLDNETLLSGDVLIASPNRIGDLEEWALTHPGERIEYQYDCQVPIMAVYQVP